MSSTAAFKPPLRPPISYSTTHLRRIQPPPPPNLKHLSVVSSLQFSDPCAAISTAPLLQKPKRLPIMTPTVNDKLHILVAEFKSLPEPIDRVKRLLHYASILPGSDGSIRVEENRVSGCTTQVWLEVSMDVEGRMRFRADSDSEITKGFCFCLIWLLDGASAEEVMGARVDDLRDMNVGSLPIRASSRVNTWHNVLISMQKRTKDLILQR